MWEDESIQIDKRVIHRNYYSPKASLLVNWLQIYWKIEGNLLIAGEHSDALADIEMSVRGKSSTGEGKVFQFESEVVKNASSKSISTKMPTQGTNDKIISSVS